MRGLERDEASRVIVGRNFERRNVYMRTGVVLIAASLALGGCLRYVPSRAELERKNGRSASELGGAEEFKAAEERRRSELNRLLTERAPLLGASSDSSYRIGVGDVLTVDVFGLPELTGEFEVSPIGTIAPNLLGETNAKGLSIAELREQLRRAYGSYVKNPQVRVAVKEFVGSRVSVVGAVTKPGLYPLRSGGKLLTDIIAEAGGRTVNAGSSVILIPASMRGMAPEPGIQVASQQGVASVPGAGGLQEHRGERGLEIDLDELYGSTDQAPLMIPLVSGDIITVPEAGSVEVDGEVQTPGSYKLSSKLSSLGAVAAAGGFTYSADVNQVEIIRDVGEGKKASLVLDLEAVALNGKSDVRLHNGDVVRVPSEPGRFTKRQIVEAINGFFRVGVSGSVR
jgi:polysaccharide export outer membrane protein